MTQLPASASASASSLYAEFLGLSKAPDEPFEPSFTLEIIEKNVETDDAVSKCHSHGNVSTFTTPKSGFPVAMHRAPRSDQTVCIDGKAESTAPNRQFHGPPSARTVLNVHYSTPSFEKGKEDTFFRLIPDSDKLNVQDIAKLEWTNPLAVETAEKQPNSGLLWKLHQLRFDFNGQLHSDIYNLKNSETFKEALHEATEEALFFYKGLHHHGDDPDLPGYTLPELLHLSKSTSTPQSIFALRLLAEIFANSRLSIPFVLENQESDDRNVVASFNSIKPTAKSTSTLPNVSFASVPSYLCGFGFGWNRFCAYATRDLKIATVIMQLMHSSNLTVQSSVLHILSNVFYIPLHSKNINRLASSVKLERPVYLLLNNVVKDADVLVGPSLPYLFVDTPAYDLLYDIMSTKGCRHFNVFHWADSCRRSDNLFSSLSNMMHFGYTLVSVLAKKFSNQNAIPASFCSDYEDTYDTRNHFALSWAYRNEREQLEHMADKANTHFESSFDSEETIVSNFPIMSLVYRYSLIGHIGNILDLHRGVTKVEIVCIRLLIGICLHSRGLAYYIVHDKKAIESIEKLVASLTIGAKAFYDRKRMQSHGTPDIIHASQLEAYESIAPAVLDEEDMCVCVALLNFLRYIRLQMDQTIISQEYVHMEVSVALPFTRQCLMLILNTDTPFSTVGVTEIIKYQQTQSLQESKAFLIEEQKSLVSLMAIKLLRCWSVTKVVEEDFTALMPLIDVFMLSFRSKLSYLHSQHSTLELLNVGHESEKPASDTLLKIKQLLETEGLVVAQFFFFAAETMAQNNALHATAFLRHCSSLIGFLLKAQFVFTLNVSLAATYVVTAALSLFVSSSMQILSDVEKVMASATEEDVFISIQDIITSWTYSTKALNAIIYNEKYSFIHSLSEALSSDLRNTEYTSRLLHYCNEMGWFTPSINIPVFHEIWNFKAFLSPTVFQDKEAYNSSTALLQPIFYSNLLSHLFRYFVLDYKISNKLCDLDKTKGYKNAFASHADGISLVSKQVLVYTSFFTKQMCLEMRRQLRYGNNSPNQSGQLRCCPMFETFSQLLLSAQEWKLQTLENTGGDAAHELIDGSLATLSMASCTATVAQALEVLHSAKYLDYSDFSHQIIVDTLCSISTCNPWFPQLVDTASSEKSLHSLLCVNALDGWFSIFFRLSGYWKIKSNLNHAFKKISLCYTATSHVPSFPSELTHIPFCLVLIKEMLALPLKHTAFLSTINAYFPIYTHFSTLTETVANVFSLQSNEVTEANDQVSIYTNIVVEELLQQYVHNFLGIRLFAAMPYHTFLKKPQMCDKILSSMVSTWFVMNGVKNGVPLSSLQSSDAAQEAAVLVRSSTMFHEKNLSENRDPLTEFFIEMPAKEKEKHFATILALLEGFAEGSITNPTVASLLWIFTIVYFPDEFKLQLWNDRPTLRLLGKIIRFNVRKNQSEEEPLVSYLIGPKELYLSSLTENIVLIKEYQAFILNTTQNQDVLEGSFPLFLALHQILVAAVKTDSLSECINKLLRHSKSQEVRNWLLAIKVSLSVADA